jgi:3-hydroxyacyl-[acyl-carrier-protein] dehydratase
MESQASQKIDERILTRIPHRPPMLLVDEIVNEEATSILCRKTIRDDEFFLQGHYPDNPIVPGIILCECAAQSGALLISQRVTHTDGVPVLTRISDAKFKKMVRPGDQIEIQVTLDEELAGAFFMTARVTLDGKLAVRVQLACTLAPADAAS